MRYVFGDCMLDPDRRELSRGSGVVTTGPQVFDLLLYLVRHREHVVSKDELLAEVWPGTIVEENNLQVQISALRKALGDGPDASRYLLTVPGRGYRFVAAVERAVGQTSSSVLPQQAAPAQPAHCRDLPAAGAGRRQRAGRGLRGRPLYGDARRRGRRGDL